MDKVRRILVYVSRDRAAPQPAHFVQSVTGLFADGGEDEVEVSCCLDQNRFLLSGGPGPPGGPAGPRVPLKRAASCPIQHLSPEDAAAVPPETRARGVDVGVAVLLQTAGQRLLLTRRARDLRIFPGVWVPPGGHVEPGETLLQAGLREVEEETGLRLEPQEAAPTILGLWESVFPAFRSRGLPHRHHVVVYVLLRSPLTHLQLQASLSPSPAEVGACLWMDVRLARAVVSAADGGDDPGDVPDTVSMSLVSPDGSLSNSSLSGSVFTSPAPTSGPDVERVSTGTIYALEKWLQSLHPNAGPTEG
ncbi:nucleoside diphosphate-linked moiety X motif 17 [Cololabis saira]|uniref:nucleoside diphosphate-linked moiety X motif 17 n=1 Tax=Cololabis saira TaxID=129043 RepID=UPI002AD358BE|nr:nucleoside diphosphate-linked moiety X motif 17 [Cololabis saira]